MSENFTVAICTRNRANFLRRCLTALVETLEDLEVPVFVVDNGSTDETADVLSEFHPRVRGMSQPNVGLSHARNSAMTACTTDYLVFLDDDGIPSAEWGSAVATIVREHRADVFGGPYTPFYTSSKPSWFDDSLGSAHMDLVEGPQAGPVCFSGGNMGWRLSLLTAAGGFDPALGVSGERLRLGEETAIQLALRKKYPDLVFEFSPGMRMVHHVSVEKMTLRYVHRRSYVYGWQLREIDPDNPVNDMPFHVFARRTKLGLPLLVRLFWRRERSWRRYAANYLSLNSILLGAQARRWYSPWSRRIDCVGGR